MLSTPLLIVLLALVLLLQLATLAGLLYWLRAYLRDQFGQLLVVLRELQHAVRLLGEQLGTLQRASAEQAGDQARALEQQARAFEEQTRVLQGQTRLIETGIMPAQAQANAEIRELRAAVVLLEREVAAQAHRVLSHLAWEEVERYISEDETPEAEKDFFRRLRAGRLE